jgi:hypothetical protein
MSFGVGFGQHSMAAIRSQSSLLDFPGSSWQMHVPSGLHAYCPDRAA